MAFLLQRLGNHLFERCFPVYRPIYSVFKSLSDRAERQLLRQHLSPGMTAVDVGANIGVYSRFMASLVGPTGKVHCFEPSPHNFARLRTATQAYSQIVCNPMAVGAESKEMALYLSESLNVDHRMYPTPDESRKELAVRCIALDDYFPVGTAVNLLKLDIQGYELEALRGAERVIVGSRDIKVLLEFWPFALQASGSRPETLPRFLEERGFHVQKIDRGGRLTSLGEDDFVRDEANYCNLFAMRPMT